MKSDYNKLVEELQAAIAQEQENMKLYAEQMDKRRKRYEDAMKRKDAALSADDKEAYKKAGLEAEEARLELEYYEKKNESKPAATQEDAKRIRAELTREAQMNRSAALSRIKVAMTEAAAACSETQSKRMEINRLFGDWNRIVLKKNGADDIYSSEMNMAIASLANMIDGIIGRINMIQGN